MNHEKYRKYIYWGVTAFLVCGLVALMVFLMINWKKAEGIMALLKDILAPIIYGARVCLSDDSYLQPGSGSSDTAGRKDEAVEKDQ